MNVEELAEKWFEKNKEEIYYGKKSIKEFILNAFKAGFSYGSSCAFDDGRQAGYKQALDEFNEENGTNYKLVIGD